MTTADLTVDASIWVSVLDEADIFNEESRTFLAAVTLEGVRLIVPAFAVAEVACALARKLRNAVAARRLTQEALRPSGVTHVPVDTVLVETAQRVGTDAFLRGADALYAATAQTTGTSLVSWDNELIQRAGAISPTAWLNANP